MSFTDAERLYGDDANVITVAKPFITTFSSFGEGLADPATQVRMRQARQDWRVTDQMRVQSYSCSSTTLRVSFESVTLDIVANSPTVNWQLCGVLPPLAERCDVPSIVIHADYGFRRQVFNRDTVLRQIIGQRIRYAPSANELYLIWKPNHEIAIFSLPLAEQYGWLLYFE